MFDIEETPIFGARLLRPRVRRDARGAFVKTFHEPWFREQGLATGFVEQYYSISHRDVLRGLHFQIPPHQHCKLVTCVEGEILDALVDLRPGALGRWATFQLNSETADTLYIPPGVAHGFHVRSDRAILLYNVTSAHAPEHDCGIRWDSAGVPWNVLAPQISERDLAFPALADFKTPFEQG
jgi:dTDP-4-dehydrorhamnose 3,5-epimerase